MKNKSSLTFTFEGEHEVDARSLVTAVHGLITISDVIAKQNYPGVEFRLSVRALKPGSLSFDFVSAAAVVQNLFTADNVEYAKDLIECLKAVFEIKSFLKGRPPKSKTESGNSITIENKDGSKMLVPVRDGVYFINPVIDQSITNIFSGSSKTPEISGVRLTHGDSVVEIPAEDFPVLSHKIDVTAVGSASKPKDSRFTVTRRNEILYVRKPDLLSDAKWEFKSDKYITADIEDLAFLESVHSGRQSIVARMYIIADLRVVMEIGPDGLPDENSCRYTVIKVHDVHMLENGQCSLID